MRDTNVLYKAVIRPRHYAVVSRTELQINQTLLTCGGEISMQYVGAPTMAIAMPIPSINRPAKN